ncbi:N-formylglutamate amidohydrolase [Brucella sp. 6810]|uniref:N-formylglutamate amidohydrolase n=1 Tax=unclassified Brucella TaxID=2632610 RepID=UPI0009728C26|nr:MULTISPECIES: N-formylglutamate amidohydrolase [unclassified Brucella]APY15323.1 N-formylglutamate amidohydrolase [Brucella sp. 09RB8910]MRN46597.1 N-formylglutamate amidohydrolase [Brucella sp. 10RB9212]MRN50648.1 N-formylglutamate amidohydrolase [Brucella sp. 10RB9214]QNQ63908.1 N-formylglutamate amidohydrolase [Brucella sp. 6810]
MSLERDFGSVPPFEVSAPAQQRIPFVFNSPHSGRHYPLSFVQASRLDAISIRNSEDCYVDELFASAMRLGAPLLKANFPRAFLDVNREPYELDPRMFAEPLPPFANSHSARVAGGLGTVPRLVAEGQLIYPGRIPLAEALYRIEDLYKPYHAALDALLEATRQQFGYAVLIDCHSMPGGTSAGEIGSRPDFIVGDRFGRSCSERLTQATIELLQDLGYTVAHNKPYAGGFITEHYGRPAMACHALQIEVNRSLYVNEQNLHKLEGFEALCVALHHFVSDLTSLPDDLFIAPPLAAE